MGRRLRGESDMQTRNGNLVMADQDTSYVGNRPRLQAFATSVESVPRLETGKVDPQTVGDQQSGRENHCKGGQKACRRLPELGGGVV
jgi:hypothetical protein